ncbi:hypothetical protein FOCC_FOCC007319 [Frankliniella occidentalis]|nr:hypothetical protein FOCC_FOCC007319 [Frankliniella occidentalis]
MSGSEMHNFTLIFSLLVGDLISTKDKVWKYYLLLRKILDVVYAPAIQVQYIDSFSHLVASHHKMYKKLFKNTLKPKHHNLLHYARVRKQSGPLSHLSTFRYEARHKPNKEAAVATSSRRDPLKNEERSDLQVPDPDRYGVFGQVSWVQFKGTKYRPNMCVCHNVNESHGLPEFEENYFAYEIQETVDHKNVPLNSLPIFSPVIFRTIACSDQLLMTLRHAL